MCPLQPHYLLFHSCIICIRRGAGHSLLEFALESKAVKAVRVF
jgi:hypothetical protein